MATDAPKCATKTLHVSTPTGEDIELSCEDETILQLKMRLQSSEQVPEKFRTAPTRALRLVFGTEVLPDDLHLSDPAGPKDGDQLSLIVSLAPCGIYKSEISEVGHGPAADNTWIIASADFTDHGDFTITMEESEITSDDEDEDYDPYENRAAWDHCYRGTVQMDGSDFRMTITSMERKGIFDDKLSHGDELLGKLGHNQVELQLPFAAGGCNSGPGPGLLWITLMQDISLEDRRPSGTKESL